MAKSNTRETDAKPKEYVVVARRYRPQTFSELVGQDQVSQALTTAITTNRVGHAYLFTGARGVGKTSTARIFAKALNCVKGPTPTPCNQCDICQGITSGDDLDVIEIDGASNRGIDEIRQLRSNVNIRPSRARFKIYIIDEVHMLTLQAFNALLKTLEEPPEHVKFIFCTTDPEKIPITILSRCQRYDFPPVEAESIVGRLKTIVENEGLQADDEALQLLARRANGSMRDSQSLLEQLLSFSSERITEGDVHAMLGTARGGQLTLLVQHLETGGVAGAFRELDKALAEGVDAGQLAEQLVGFFRDVLAAEVGCEQELMLHTARADYETLREIGGRLGVERLLAVIQILDHSIGRMRQSVHVRTLLEVALARICNLGSLEDLSDVVAQLRQGTIGSASASTAVPAKRAADSPPQKKNDAADEVVGMRSALATAEATSEPASGDVPLSRLDSAVAEANLDAPSAPLDLTDETLDQIWKQALESLGDMTAECARHAQQVALAGPNRMVASFAAAYHKETCERPERRAKLETALSRLAGRAMRIDFELTNSPADVQSLPKPLPSARQRQREREKHPLVRRAIEMFDAEVVRVDEPKSTN